MASYEDDIALGSYRWKVERVAFEAHGTNSDIELDEDLQTHDPVAISEQGACAISKLAPRELADFGTGRYVYSKYRDRNNVEKVEHSLRTLASLKVEPGRFGIGQRRIIDKGLLFRVYFSA